MVTRLLVTALLILAIASCLPGDRAGSPAASPAASPTPATAPPVPSGRPLPTTTFEVPPPI